MKNSILKTSEFIDVFKGFLEFRVFSIYIFQEHKRDLDMETLFKLHF